MKTYLAFHKVSDAGFGHDGYRDGFHDLFDHLGITHTSYTSLGANVGWYALESHDGYGAGFFCYACL